MNDYWYSFMERFSSDERLNVIHIALLTAITYMGIKQRRKKKIIVSRSRFMKNSHIKTIPTYHKYFKELQEFGYFINTPSYHPAVRSFVIINK